MRTPLIEIRIEPGPRNHYLKFLSRPTGRRLELEVESEQLAATRHQVHQMMDDFKQTVGSAPVPDGEKVRSALRKLLLKGNVRGGELTGQASGGMEQIRSLCVEAIPDWASRRDVPLVLVEGPAYGFPFELLPVFDTSRPPDHIEDLGAFSRRFLGFSAAVRRVPYTVAGRDGIPVGSAMAGNPLAMTFAWHARLAGARQEHEFFKNLAPHVELDGPWPVPEDPADFVVHEFAQGLADPRHRYGKEKLGQAIQIVHLSCHCDTQFEDPDDYELRLAAVDGPDRRITFENLYNEVQWAEPAPSAVGRPFVFLNACGAGYQDPNRVYSWPKWFLQERHVAVVGPETLVPDKTAAEYALHFYRALFSRRTLGEALVLARRQLLAERGNPLGLLYVLYGDSEITVEEQLPLEVLNGDR